MKNILKYEDLLEIEAFLREKELDSGNLSVVMNIETQERLDRINKDYFFKANPDEKECPLTHVDHLNIQIGNVTFIYQLKDKKGEEW